MVAEPFIFLSKDRQVDVRCYRIHGQPFFCIKDFIRRVSRTPMGPLDAVQYWLSISCEVEHEQELMNTYVHRFPGPYEMPEVCISASGLMLVMHYLDAMHGLVNQSYRAEVNERLLDVARGGGEEYIEEHDDGEIEEQLRELEREEGGSKAEAAETADVGIGAAVPPSGSRFWYRPTVKVDGTDEEMELHEAARLADERCRALQTALERAEEEVAKLKAASEETEAALRARVEELEGTLGRQNEAKGSFKLTTLIKEMGMDIKEDRIVPLCKQAVKRFRSENPQSCITTRKGVLCFMPRDREELERILLLEHLQSDLEHAEREHYDESCHLGAPAAGADGIPRPLLPANGDEAPA